MSVRRPQREWLVALASVVAAAVFFTGLARLWPLVDTPLVVSAAEREEHARAFLSERGFDLTGYRSASAVTVDTFALDYVEPAFGRERTQEWVRAGLPLTQHRVYFKRPGDRRSYTVALHAGRDVIGWSRRVEEDDAGAALDLDAARALALAALEDGLGLDAATFTERTASTTQQPERRDHSFVYETLHESDPELRERVTLTVAGDTVILAWREIRVPPAARRAARAAEAPGRALETFGFVLLGASILGAFFVFLRCLRDGEVRLLRAMFWPAVVFVGLLGTYALETASLFRNWEPLWPAWVSAFQYLSFRALEGVAIALLLLVVIAAGDALDRRAATSGAGRGASLWTLARGRIDRAVALASVRGFLVGLLCGGTLATVVIALQAVAGAETALQPRGFFFYTLNTAAPALTSLLFFLAVALSEELGYRFFAGTWLLTLTGRRSVAIWLPALIYGLTHTRLDFLPPAEPWWARALALTLVGAVWGWAFLRYDALTVVLSHFTADLFIFNWPRLASGDPSVVAVSVATVVLPLVPALLFAVGLRGRTDPAT